MQEHHEGSDPQRLPRIQILTPDPETEALLRPNTARRTWHDDLGKLCMWATVRQDRPCLVAPGLALYELGDDAVVATPVRFGVEGAIEDIFWRSVLPLFLQHRGVQVLHASAIVGPAGVVGFCGRAGSGKSTVAYGLSRRGHRLWADDALVLSGVAPPRTIALEGEIRLMPDVREQLGGPFDSVELEGDVGEERDLSLLVVLSAEPGSLGEEPRPLTSGDAFAAILEHAYCYDLEATKRAMAADYLALLERVPAAQISRPEGFEGFEAFLDEVEGLMTAGSP